MIAREIAEEPKLLIAAQPTRGLDVGAIEFVHSQLIEQRDAGRGVLLVSLELEEIRSLSDRVLVMYDGRIVAELSPEASEEEFGVAMLGGKRERGVSGAQPSLTVASKLSGYLRAGGIITPLLTALIAFFIGGLVIAFTGSSPFTTYKAIFEGSGLNWLFPWISAEDRTLAALNLQQTLILTTPLILTGMAVAYAFRAGLFNIGGQGQYFAGLYLGVWVGSSLEGLPGLPPHRARARARDAGGRAVGRARRLPEGEDRRQRGDHDDHAQLLSRCGSACGRSGSAARCTPTPRRTRRSRSRTRCIGDARLPVFWGDPELQGLHIGIFIAARRARAVLGAPEPLRRRL